MKIRIWRVLSGKILAQGFSAYSTIIGKREPLDAKRSSPCQGGRDVLKREPLDAERRQHVREEESKGMASCPEKGPKVTSVCVATDGSWRMKVCWDGCSTV
jgi:hypothetical protein